MTFNTVSHESYDCDPNQSKKIGIPLQFCFV